MQNPLPIKATDKCTFDAHLTLCSKPSEITLTASLNDNIFSPNRNFELSLEATSASLDLNKGKFVVSLMRKTTMTVLDTDH